MKASSVGLEVFVEINSKELDKLKIKPLEGNIKFRDNTGFPDRDIPFIIKFLCEQKELLFVETNPKNEYLGIANKIEFSINDDYYKELTENGIFGNRYFTGGKLIMKVEGIYTPY